MAATATIETLLLFAVLAPAVHAEDFRLNYLGTEPISLHTALSYEGNGAHLIATAKNESGQTIQHAKICIVAYGWQKECLFQLWNEVPWTPGSELEWDVKSSRHVAGGLAHTASITEFDGGAKVPAAPVASVPAIPVTAKPLPSTPVGPQLPTSAKIAKLPNLQIGTVLDTQSAKTFVTTGATSQANTTGTNSGTFSSTTTSNGMTNGSYFGTENSHTSAATQIHNMTITEKQLLIVTQDFIYRVNDAVEKPVGFDLYGSLGRVIANHKHGCHVIVNDPVQFSQDKGYLNVVDVDGKICRMEIDRQERILPAPGATATPAALPQSPPAPKGQ
jgi:hypothetical protein